MKINALAAVVVIFPAMMALTRQWNGKQTNGVQAAIRKNAWVACFALWFVLLRLFQKVK